MVGCGGTGSWLAPHVYRIAALLRDRGKDVEVVCVDPDTVEPRNLVRQNFCRGDLGRNKARIIADRYGMAWGFESRAIAAVFDQSLLASRTYGITVLVGCVDNAAARRAIAAAAREDRTTWWLDCGNAEHSGQVLVGNLEGDPVFAGGNDGGPPSFAEALPLPSYQHPELLDSATDAPPEVGSCAEQSERQEQSPTINARIAAEAADYLYRLLVSRDLKRHATYIDTVSGAARSLAIAPPSP